MAKAVNKSAMSYDEWRKFRKDFIGSSDVPVILGLVKWKTPYSLYQEKVAEVLPPDVDTPKTRAGKRLEQVVADYFQEATGWTIRKDNKIRLSKTKPWAIVNLDRVIASAPGKTGPGVLECKTTSSYYIRSLDTEVPPSYYAQLQYQLFVTGYTWGALGILIDGYDFRYILVDYDPAFMEKALAVLEDFYQHMETKTPPPMLGPDADQLLSDPDKVVAADNLGLEADLDDLAKAEEAVANAKAAADEIRDRIKVAMADAEVLVRDGRTAATYKTVTRKAYQVKETSYRKFQLKLEKEKV